LRIYSGFDPLYIENIPTESNTINQFNNNENNNNEDKQSIEENEDEDMFSPHRK